jgi:GNAT superfamily N-acetyltransferase
VNISIRPAITADAPQVASVLLTSRKISLPFAPLAHTDAEVRAWVRDVLIPAGGVTVACEDNTVIGMIDAAHEPGVSWIHQLYVAPSRVGRGIGTQLLAQALTLLPRPIRLYTFQQNSGSRRFYERHGFVAIALSDGAANEERCPDVLYELR